MLRDLCIRNFALIDELQISFDKGLNIVTGETGAGKSILITAISLLLGGRASTNFIRSGVDFAEVEASFQIDSHPIIHSHIKFAGFPIAIHEDIIIRRIIYRSEKSNRCYINDRLCSLGTLVDIGTWLIDMHGQHEHQLLLHPANHLSILDKFGFLENDRHEVSKYYNQFIDLQSQFNSLKEKEKSSSQEHQLLLFQKKELDEANIQNNELESLCKEKEILANAKRIRESTTQMQQTLYQSDGSVSEILSRTQISILELSKIDKFFQPLADQLESAIYQIEDISTQLRDYGERFDMSAESLNEIEIRIDEIKRLQKKYKVNNIESLLELRSSIEKKLNNFESLHDNIQKAENMLDSIKIKLKEKNSILSNKREIAAKQLESKLNKEFLSLNMNQTRFSTSFKPIKKDTAFSATGWDQIEFIISTNIGEPLKPLAQIASGGEISRIMLAIKSSLAEADQVLTLTFDEIDTGVGGKQIGVIAKKLKLLSNRQQIICITHSPQIASFADAHYMVRKNISKKRTLVQVKKLRGHERIEEIAKMMGADANSKIALQHAKEILEKSDGTFIRELNI